METKIKLEYVGKQYGVDGFSMRLWNVVSPRFPQFDYKLGYPTMGIDYMKQLGVLK